MTELRFRERQILNYRASILLIAGLCAYSQIVNASDLRSRELALRATAAIRAGDLESGISLLRTAIESDATRTRLMTLDAKQTVSASALAHGREQFRRLSADRPRLLDHSESAGFDLFASWATSRFAGAGMGFTVDWVEAPPTDGHLGHVAESMRPFGGARAQLRISRVFLTEPQSGQELPCEKLWSALVFELINLSNAEAAERTYQQALNGNLSRTEYVSAIFRREHRAVQLTQEFYCNKYLPWTRTANVRTDPEHWFVSASVWWETAEEALDQFPFVSSYPWQGYGEQFDQIGQRSIARAREPPQFTNSFAEQSPAELASQATAALERGDYEAGLSHLVNAITLRNRQTEVARTIDVHTALNGKALAYGREQFRQLSVDRPVFLQHADKQGFDRLSEWVIRHFGGEGLGMTVDWDNAIPQTVVFGHTAEHTVPGGDIRGSVRIAKVYPTGASAGELLPFERVWSLLVYELLNLTNAREFNRVHLDVYHGELSRAGYVTEMFRLECRAVQLTQQFYTEHYLPWALKAQLPSNPDFWFISETGWWHDPVEFLDQYPFSCEYPWGYYGRVFDHIRNLPGAQSRKPPRRSLGRSRASITPNPLKRVDQGRN